MILEWNVCGEITGIVYVLEFPEYVTAWQDVHGPNLELTLALVGDGDADEQLSGGFFKLTVAPTGENACAIT